MSATSPAPALSWATLRDAVLDASANDRRAMVLIALEHGVFCVLPILVIAMLARVVIDHPNTMAAIDFHDAYYVAGHRLLHGGNPYAWTPAQLKAGVAFVYPAFSALFFAPFALISRDAADVVVTVIWILLTPLTLRILGIRDWRVYGLTLIWLPVFEAWQTGNETILLVLISAAAWRYRDRPLVAGVLTAAAISLKPFVWPLALWLLATRRWRASGYGLIAGIAINLVSWSVVGWDKIGVFLRDSRIDTHDAWRGGYTIAALVSHLGLSHAVGNLITGLASAALLSAVAYVGLVKRDERRALTLAIALMLVASPLVWTHYFALLLVPMAIERPKLNILWFLPVLMWVCPASAHVYGWEEAVALLVAVTMLTALARQRRAPRSHWLTRPAVV